MGPKTSISGQNGAISVSVHLWVYWALREPFEDQMGAQFGPKEALVGLYVVHTGSKGAQRVT